jgi:hypothetical protein
MVGMMALILIIFLGFDFAEASQCGLFIIVKGNVQIKTNKKKWRKAKIGKKVCEGNRIKTPSGGMAKIVMKDKNILTLSSSTQIHIFKYKIADSSPTKQVHLNLIYGKVRSLVKQKYKGKNEHFRVQTPSAVAGVRGTDFLTSFDKNTKEAKVVTFSGLVAVGDLDKTGNLINTVQVEPGFATSVQSGKKATKPLRLPASDFKGIEKSSNINPTNSGNIQLNNFVFSETEDVKAFEQAVIQSRPQLEEEIENLANQEGLEGELLNDISVQDKEIVQKSVGSLNTIDSKNHMVSPLLNLNPTSSQNLTIDAGVSITGSGGTGGGSGGAIGGVGGGSSTIPSDLITSPPSISLPPGSDPPAGSIPGTLPPVDLPIIPPVDPPDLPPVL